VTTLGMAFVILRVKLAVVIIGKLSETIIVIKYVPVSEIEVDATSI
jgi:hypothetical protein